MWDQDTILSQKIKTKFLSFGGISDLICCSIGFIPQKTNCEILPIVASGATGNDSTGYDKLVTVYGAGKIV